jgi:serine protease Do
MNMTIVRIATFLLVPCCLFLEFVQAAQSRWQAVAQEASRGAVVQILAERVPFNWLQPFKVADHKKNYGTGFFIDAEGLLLTNFHVIELACAIKIQVPLCGKEQFDVEVVGACPNRDIALLRLTPVARQKLLGQIKEIPFFRLGDSDKVIRTQEILLWGYPLGQENLKSAQGTVSGWQMVSGTPYIQVAGPLNLGNSGGPSQNADGEVIGVNTSRMKAAQSIGYIIPINDVKTLIEPLKHRRLLSAPALGGEYNLATKQMTDFLGNPQPGGLYIARVYRGSLLEKAGICDGDMIYNINGHAIDVYGETSVSWSDDKVSMDALLNRCHLGQIISLVVYRQGKRIETELVFEDTEPLPIRRMYPGFEEIPYEIFAGMVIMPLTLNHLEKLIAMDISAAKDLHRYQRQEEQYEPRVLVTHVFPTSQVHAARSLQRGDVLASINGIPVKTLADVRRAFEQARQEDKPFISVMTENKHLVVLDTAQALEQK